MLLPFWEEVNILSQIAVPQVDFLLFIQGCVLKYVCSYLINTAF